MTPLLSFWQSHAAELSRLVAQHLGLVLVSTIVAAAIGIPAGIVAARRPRIGGPLAVAANIVQAIPSLALFGFLLPLPLIGGIGARTALVALTLYALLPVIRTTAAGLRSIDAAVLEAADAMGMTARQRLLQVELPLALPAIIAGVRVAAVIGVGTVTIAAAIGAGGLGEYIYRGLSMVDATVILAGAIPVAVLALSVDGLLFLLERTLSARRRRSARAPLLATAAVAIGAAAVIYGSPGGGDRVVVGSKNFTEQVILGELMAQALERYGNVRGRAPSESRRHLHLRPRAADRRHRPLRRIQRHGPDRRLQAAGAARVVGGARTDPHALRRQRPDDAAAARFQQHLRDPRAPRGCRERWG